MNSVIYVDNSFLLGSKKPGRKFSYGRKKRFTSSIILFPFLVSAVGLVLVSIPLVPSLISAKEIRTTSASNPAANLTDTSTEQKAAFVSKIVAKEEIKTAQAENFTEADIPGLGLSATRDWPLRGRITNFFSGAHPAIDIAGRYGTPIHSFMEGIVTQAGWRAGGYGNSITISHADGFESVYAHLRAVNVKVGQKVEMGAVIGAEGSSGWATGPHLHFQVVRNGASINPLSVLP